MNILLLNQLWFKEEFEEAGHCVKTIGLIGDGFDVKLKNPFLHIDHILQGYLPNFTPDIILIHDNSAPLAIEGLHEIKAPVIFYSVDAHHHIYFHKYLGLAFDYTFVAQKEYIQHFHSVGANNVEWLPLWAPIYVNSSQEKRYNAVFIGNMDKDLNPERVAFFEALQKEIDIYCAQGKYWEVFPYAKVILNQTVKGDLNFRVFESMMCGSLLLTEKTGNGLLELFEEGKHLATYEKNNINDAASKVKYYLQHQEEREKIAKLGREEVLKKHLAKHRANRILEVAQYLLQQRRDKQDRTWVYFPWMINCLNLSINIQNADVNFSKRAILAALQAAEQALRRGEPIIDDFAYSLVHSILSFEKYFKNTLKSNRNLLKKVREKYGSVPIVDLALVRDYLNSGDLKNAEILAKEISAEKTPLEIFNSAEVVMRSILNC